MSCLLHQVEPIFEPAFATLSLVTYVSHQNNNFFCQRIGKKTVVFVFNSRFLNRVGTTTYWPRQGKRKESTFQTFFLIFDFINEPFEIPEQLTVEQKLLKVKGYIKVFNNC